MSPIEPMSDARTIEEVIQRLTRIVEDSKAANSRIGYFAALYREVTITVKQRIDEGDYFEDNARMERFDVIFANRYLAAVEAMRQGREPTKVWAFAFKVTQEWWPITLQHLLLGINAHIGLDLGIAALETDGPQGLAALEGDFNKINDLLASLVDSVKTKLATVWAPLRWLNRYLGDLQDGLINFSMLKARDSAWSFAKELATLDPDAREAAIARRDEDMRVVSRAVRYPGFVLGAVTKAIRIGEQGSVSQIIEILEGEGRQWRAGVALHKRVPPLPQKRPEDR